MKMERTRRASSSGSITVMAFSPSQQCSTTGPAGGVVIAAAIHHPGVCFQKMGARVSRRPSQLVTR